MREGRPGFPPLLSSGDPPEQELSEERIIFFLAVFLCFPPTYCLAPKPPSFSITGALSVCLGFQHVIIDVFAYSSGLHLK